MGLPSNTNALQNGFWQGYTIGRSLRFRASASAYLSRTIGTPSTTTNTFSAWVKRGDINTAYRPILMCTNNNSGINYQLPSTSANDTLQILDNGSNLLVTNAVYRDPSAWYHIVVVWDSTNATSTERVRLYVNGARVTSFSTASYPAQNAAFSLFSASNPWQIGSRQFPGALYFDGYMAEINYIDGQALTSASFGAYDNNGIWEPIKYTGTYGTNGFYLPFSNTTSTTTLVQDSSGNGNNWTPNNISLTAGSTYDSMLDSPTVSNISSNYAVYNQLDRALPGATFSNANLDMSTSAAQNYGKPTIFPSSGKWYCEFTITAKANSTFNQYAIYINSSTDAIYAGYEQTGQFYNGSAWNGSAVYSVWAVNGVIGVAMDLDAGTVRFYYNNTVQGASTISIPTGNPTAPVVYSQAASNGMAVNFGQRPFTYSAPSGFNSLNTYNLPASLVQNGSQYMAATTYTGTGSTLSITNNGNNAGGYTFQPDLVWIKSRSAVSDHAWYDSVRGATFDIASNLATGQTTQSTGVTSFDSNGFTIGSLAKINTNAATYVAWQWRAGQGTTSTNTSGSITSTVSVSAQSGFSVVSYTGTGAAATIGHGLGVAPQMIFVKKTSASDNWGVYHVSDPSPAASYALTLNSTATAGLNTTYWNAVAPTSSVFSVGTAAQTNTNGATYIAYCFAPVNGYSSFGSYAGNGSATDGPFVYTGFRPRFILVKRSVGGIASWAAFDTSRSAFNLSQSPIYPNVTNAEATVSFGDILSNGFKLRATAGEMNGASSTYVYAAFAENPFSIARAR